MGKGMVRWHVTHQQFFMVAEHWLPGKGMGLTQMATGMTAMTLEWPPVSNPTLDPGWPPYLGSYLYLALEPPSGMNSTLFS